MDLMLHFFQVRFNTPLLALIWELRLQAPIDGFNTPFFSSSIQYSIVGINLGATIPFSNDGFNTPFFSSSI